MKRAWAFAVVATTLAAPSRARAEDGGDSDPKVRKVEPYPAAHHPRIFTGIALGIGGSDVRIDGVPKSEGGTNMRPTFELGYSHPVIDSLLGVVLLARAGDWSSSWSTSAGEARYALDIGVGPELVFEQKPRRPNSQVRVALPIGYTHAWIHGHDGRAVVSSYSPGNGFHFGLVGGIDISGTHSGAFINLGYMIRLIGLDHTATLQSSPGTFAEESYRFVDHSLYCSMGFLYRP